MMDYHSLVNCDLDTKSRVKTLICLYWKCISSNCFKTFQPLRATQFFIENAPSATASRSVCYQHSRTEEVNASLLQQVSNLQAQAQEIVEALGQSPTFPASSCAALLPSPSGDYWIRASNGSAVFLRCGVDFSCGGITGGWTRVIEQDYNNGDPCPSGFTQRMDSSLITCVPEDDSSTGCFSAEYDVLGLTYSNVCGKVICYQFGTPEAFSRFHIITNSLLLWSTSEGKLTRSVSRNSPGAPRHSPRS